MKVLCQLQASYGVKMRGNSSTSIAFLKPWTLGEAWYDGGAIKGAGEDSGISVLFESITQQIG